ncbi:magnesium-translocating P-type ATPase [Lacipirellula parvula]|uniref:Magnesium-transporting ATPase, P-type 1 n=1 Tax=Lacipirellula parvula TaxID=2650471 RepID=A0A5K7XBQ7_9BACT|nr:magnesium-translocating P-type ATPase [Lacipirellula parvula]BBO32291.1 mg transport ATPase [Lacipirellula parvula]
MNDNPQDTAFWASTVDQQMLWLQSTRYGLSALVAEDRYRSQIARRPVRKRHRRLRLFLSQFKSPITLLLIGTATLSILLHDHVDALIVLIIVFAGAFLGFWQEWGAAGALEKLLALVSTKSVVLRDSRRIEIPTDQVVPGDVVELSAGTTIPGDCLLIECSELHVDEATLTGESFPVEKRAGVVPADALLSQRSNTLLAGTHVVSGFAQALVIQNGSATEFGRISQRLELRPPETEFERGIRHLGNLLLEVTMALLVVIFAANVLFKRDVLEALMFALALAVGLTPQLLPAIISVNLAQGARQMAKLKVIVKRLSSIENFGSMNVLCSDKTGTLTTGIISVHSALDPAGTPCDATLRAAAINAWLQAGFANPIDEAIRKQQTLDATYRKVDEFPYDFIRKRLSVLVESDGEYLLISKGAVDNVLSACSSVKLSDESCGELSTYEGAVHRQYCELSAQGFRTLGIAECRYGASLPGGERTNQMEREMTFLGFLVLQDPPKEGIADTISQINGLGITLKMVTGDNSHVAEHVAKQVGLATSSILTGGDLRQLSDEALLSRVRDTDVFAEIEPNQKERIILALQKAGEVVGYLGDGINDATALHAADVGISVDQAVDVAKEAADIVLLERDLNVLVQGVRAGRETFANTLKYVFMATSANFGNMFSMAGASLFLPFLPLLPKQILLLNLMTDFPEMAIANDRVDDELLAVPRRWDIAFIRRFMIVFGPLSSLFDFVTFCVLLKMGGNKELFRTAWFFESLISACLVVVVVRTRRPFWKSQPGRLLSLANALMISAAFILPFLAWTGTLGFVPLPPTLIVVLMTIVAAYVGSVEVAKRWFYRSAINANS